MDCFKKKTGISHIYHISTHEVETVLGKDAPYYLKRGEAESYFAVCPPCDNPIQIVGVFKNTVDAGRRPYGRHYGKSIPNLAAYDESAYEDCPYSNSHWKPGALRAKSSRTQEKFLSVLREQFDRVIYILERDTGIIFSENTARYMIREYIANEGWRFRDATLNNLPWKFAHSVKALPLFGRILRADSALAKDIEARCPEVKLVPGNNPAFVSVSKRGNQFVDLKYFFCKHNVKLDGDVLREDITLRVYRTQEQESPVFEQVIPIRTDYFMNLVCLPGNHSQRNERWLKIAAEEIPVTAASSV